MMPPRLARLIRLSLFTIGLTLFVMLVLMPIGLAYVSVHSLVHHACSGGQAFNERFPDADLRDLRFSPNGADYTLGAWYWPGTNGAGIVILAGAWGSRDVMAWEAENLHQAGYNVLTYDTPNCANPPQRTSLGYTEVAALQAALDLLSAQPEVDPNRIGGFGFSMGGATLIMGAADDERLQALVAVGNYASLLDNIRGGAEHEGLWERWLRYWLSFFYERETGVDLEWVQPIKSISTISPRAILLIYGDQEIYRNGQVLYEAAGEPKQFWLLGGADHGGYVGVDAAAYQRHILAFYDEYLGVKHDG